MHSSPDSGNNPNVVLILVDQMRFDGLGCNGNPFAVTPHLDSLAKAGTNMTRCIAANPVCMPSRASLLTGRYPSGHGLWHNGVALPRSSNIRFDPVVSGVSQRPLEGQIISNVPTLADVLGSAGYETVAIGKLHLTPTGADPAYGYEESRVRWSSGELRDWHGPYYGFDRVDMTIGHGEGTIGHYRHWLEETHPEVVVAIESGTHREPGGEGDAADVHRSVIPVEAHHSTWIADRACDFLTDHRDASDPFFLYLGFPDPHHPFTPPAELAGQFEDRETLRPALEDNEAESKPEAIARLIRGHDRRLCAAHLDRGTIDRMRQYTDAMIHLIDTSVGRVLEELDRQNLANDTIVVFTSDHGDFLGDHGLIRKDTLCARSLVHVPLVIRIPSGSRLQGAHQPMSNADVMPTLCELVGVDAPEGVQGRSIVASGAEDPDRLAPVFCYQHDFRHHNFSVFDERFRYTLYPVTGERELYDHRTDPHELRNLAGTENPVEQRLHHRLLEIHIASDNPSAGRIARF